MAGTPLSLALPAATASLAYLNAKYSIGQDLHNIASYFGFRYRLARREKRDRANTFYNFEEYAKDPKACRRIFLLLPPDPSIPKGGRTEWTYYEAYELVLKYAAWLKEDLGVQKNDVVAMDFTNKPQFVFIWFALWSLGAVPAFINSNLRGKGFVHCVRISGARLLLVDPDVREVLDDECKSAFGPDESGRAVNTLILEEEVQSAISNRQAFRASDETRSGAVNSDLCILIYTSGTTGLPKAANVPWSKTVAGTDLMWPVMELRPESRYYSALPLYHSSASLLGICVALGPGCTYVMGRRFSPRTFMKNASVTKATHIQYIGEMCRYLTTSPPTPYDKLNNVRVAFGNGMRPDVWPKFKERFGIETVVEFYGATEAPGATIVKSRNSFLQGTVGHGGLLVGLLESLSSAMVKYDTEADTPWRDPKTGFCVKCKPDEAGEMLSKLDPDNIHDKFQGYTGNEKATSSKIMRNVFSKGDAYYRTGDLMRRDRDGRLHFVDRIGDTFRWKGENVSTAEVSEALSSHPAVQEANVYGVQLPGHDGRAGCAALVLTDGRVFDEPLKKDLAAHVLRKLPRYAVPLFLRLVKQFETTGTLKQTKVALRNQGVDPTKVDTDELLWLPSLQTDTSYVSFGKEEWQSLVGGEARL